MTLSEFAQFVGTNKSNFYQAVVGKKFRFKEFIVWRDRLSSGRYEYHAEGEVRPAPTQSRAEGVPGSLRLKL